MRQDIVDLAVAVAASHSFDAALLCTFMDVESAGVPSWPNGNPKILFEKHQVVARLNARIKKGDKAAKAILAAALKAGLATPKWGGYADQVTQEQREGLLDAMARIDRATAYECVSIGMGQVMGFNHALCGYASAEEMYVALHDPRAQVEAIYAYVSNAGILPHLVAHEWAKVAALYNGPLYARNHYDAKLASAFAVWSLKFRSGQVAPPAEDTLGLGSTGPAVTAIQTKLAALGFPVRVDEVYGPKLHAAVAAFQAAHAIPGTGVVDQATADSIMAETIPMPQGAREVATAASLSPSTPGFSSRIVGAFQRIKRVHWTGAGANTGIAGIVDAHWQQATALQDKYQTLKGWFGDGPQTTALAWCATHPVVVVVGAVSVLVAYVASNLSDAGIAARVDDEKTGAAT